MKYIVPHLVDFLEDYCKFLSLIMTSNINVKKQKQMKDFKVSVNTAQRIRKLGHSGQYGEDILRKMLDVIDKYPIMKHAILNGENP